MADHYSKFLAMLARARDDPTTARLLVPPTVQQNNHQIGGQVSTRAHPQINATINDENENQRENLIEPEIQSLTNNEETNKENVLIENAVKRIRPDSPILFDSETKIAENESLEAFVVKSFFKKQKRFK